MTVGWIDMGIIAAYFTIILVVGLWKGRGERSLKDFALGGRSIPWWAVLSSIIAAETTAATFLGTPGEGYALKNFAYAQLAIGTVIGRFIIGHLFLRPYFHYNVYSIYEFLSVRFGNQSKNAASAVFLVTRLLASGTRLYIGAVIIVLAYRLYFPAGETSPFREFEVYVASIVILTALTAIYTALGGIKAVIWTDLLQAFVMIIAALATIGILFAGLPSDFLSQFQGPQDLTIIDLGLDRARSFFANLKGILESDYTLLAGLIGGTFTTLATHGTDQDMVQRMLTAKNLNDSRRSLWVSGLADIPIVLVFLGMGILLSAFYHFHPDPRLPTKTNEIFGYFILTGLPAGIRGLVVAGVFATAMGSLSAALNALATSFVRDWYLPFVRPAANDKQILRAARLSTVIFSLLMIVVASLTAFIVIRSPTSRIIPIALGIFGYTYGSMLGIFLLGVLTPRGRGTDFGNIIAMLAGFVTVTILSGLPNEIAHLFGQTLYEQPEWLPVIAFPWRILFGSFVTFAVAACFKETGDLIRPHHFKF